MKLLWTRGAPQKSTGIATLLISVVLLIAVTLLAFNMSAKVIDAERIYANDYRGVQAFNVAQSGLDHSLAILKSGVSNASSSGSLTGTGSYNWSVVTENGVTSDAENSIVTLTSIGQSEDASVTRELSLKFAYLPLIGNSPPSPVVALGSVTLTGNINITNNIRDLTVWTGQDVSGWGSANTYINIDGEDDQLSTTKTTRGPDVVDGDLNLAALSESQFLKNFFGRDFEGFSTSADLTAIPADLRDADGKIVYISGDLAINGGDWGVDADTILVVDGNLSMTGNITFNGLIIAKSLVKGAGTPVVRGSVVATENVDFGTGTFNVIYKGLSLGDPATSLFELGKVTSSWRDW